MTLRVDCTEKSGTPPSRQPEAPAAEDAFEAAGGGAGVPDESFESATVVPLSVLDGRDLEADPATEDAAPLRPPPPLEALVAKIPAETKQALEELFRARFRTVRRITSDQLR